MSFEKKQFLVGEVSKMTGLTVRTLQHYDNIGLLPVSGRTEAGRRYYTQSELIKLEQIVFYKSIGIPLNEIKGKLVDTPTLPELERTLSGHLGIMLQKISSLHMTMSVMNTSLDVIRSGSYPPWEMLTRIIRTMDGSSLNDWANYQFDKGLYDSLESRGVDVTDAIEIYHSIRDLQVEAATLSEIGCRPDDPVAQDVAKRWWEIIMNMTDGDEAAVSALSAVNKQRDTWPEADRTLFETAEPFIEAALGVYIAKNQIDVPDSLK